MKQTNKQTKTNEKQRSVPNPISNQYITLSMINNIHSERALQTNQRVEGGKACFINKKKQPQNP